MAAATSTPPKSTPPAPAPAKVRLRYLGTSDRYVDPETGLVFEVGGKALPVSEDDAQRLLSSPFDSFEKE